MENYQDLPNRTGLDMDLSITEAVTNALFNDPRTCKAVIEVISNAGLVTLEGRVETVQVRAAAEEIATQQKGVKSVVNEMVVSPHIETEIKVVPSLILGQQRRHVDQL